MRALPILPCVLAPAAALLTCSFSPRAAYAGDTVTLGVGALAAVGGNFLSKPSDKTYTLPDSSSFQDTTYPGFAGVSSGFGLMADARILDEILGLEIDLIRSSDRGHGDINNVTVEIGQDAWHLPILAKLTLPLILVSPSVFLGPEFVFPSSATATPTQAPGGAPTYSAFADNYLMWTLGLGSEFKLPLPAIDLRIPFTLRGSYAPSTSGKMQDRETYAGTATSPTSISYKSDWQYRILATLGVSIHF